MRNALLKKKLESRREQLEKNRIVVPGDYSNWILNTTLSQRRAECKRLEKLEKINQKLEKVRQKTAFGGRRNI